MDTKILLPDKIQEDESRTRGSDDWIDGYLKYSEFTEPPFLFHLWTAISAIASTLERRVWLDWGHFNVHPNHYITLVAPQGQARKSTALAIMDPILNKISLVSLPQSVTAEAMIETLMESRKTYNINDDEFVSEPQTQHAVYASLRELKNFVRANDLQMLSYLTDLYDAPDYWEYKTKNAPKKGKDMYGETKQVLINVAINIIGATTPEWLKGDNVTKGMSEGLHRRNIFVYEEHQDKIIANPTLYPIDKELQASLINDLQCIHMLNGPMTFSERGLEIYEEFYTNHWEEVQNDEPAIPGETFRGYMSTRATHLLKLCIIMSVSRGLSRIIEECDIERALKILKQTEKRMPRAFIGGGSSRVKEGVETVLTHLAERGSTTRNEILATYYKSIDPWTLEQVEKVLNSMTDTIQVVNELGKVRYVYKKHERKDASKSKSNIIAINTHES